MSEFSKIDEQTKVLLKGQFDQQIDEFNSLLDQQKEVKNKLTKLMMESRSESIEDNQVDLTQVRRELKITQQHLHKIQNQILKLYTEIPNAIHSSVEQHSKVILRGDNKLSFYQKFDRLNQIIQYIEKFDDVYTIDLRFDGMSQFHFDFYCENFNTLFQWLQAFKEEILRIQTQYGLDLHEYGIDNIPSIANKGYYTNYGDEFYIHHVTQMYGRFRI